MQIEVAKTAGFCFGVKRAVDKVYEQAGKGKVYTYGPIIHNEEVVADLAKKGVTVINSVEELEALTEGTVVIRSHGVPRKVYTAIEERGLKVVDATCPFVLRIHRIVEQASKDGRSIIIIGNGEHPEVEGIKGWAQTPVSVIATREQAAAFCPKDGERFTLVSQTTFNYKNFQELVEIISKKSYDIDISNTICNATQERQAEAMRLAQKADAMIVIGGKTSSNTRKLYEICKSKCENTYYIQTAGDLEQCCLASFGYVGITAGASTPNNIIEEVQTNVRIKF